VLLIVLMLVLEWVDYDYDYDYEHEHELEEDRVRLVKGSHHSMRAVHVSWTSRSEWSKS